MSKIQNVEEVPVAMIEGLKAMDRDELTVEEHAAVDYAEQKEIEQRQEEEQENAFVRFLTSIDGGPSVYDIEGWKQQYGAVHVSSVSGDDIYLWHTINRIQYKSLARSGALNEKDRAEEAIVRKCLLYPEPKDGFMANTPAGVISTLYNQIMYQTGFISEAEAISKIKML